MGFVVPLLAILALGVGVAWLFGGRTGPNALGLAVRRGGAGALTVVGVALVLAGRVAPGIVLIGVGLSIWRPAILEQKPYLKDGQVTRGRFRGRSLAALGEAELKALYVEVLGRPVDRSVLEAHLDRRIPGWRKDFERDAANGARGPAGAGTMTDEQAYQILGLSPGAAEPEIRAAYRRLMMKVHPDQGGSTFLAAQINQAKERLLGRHR